MADKRISDLVAATSVQSADLFVLEQNGTAKKLTGQVWMNWLVNEADGHGGIRSIEKTATSGLTDTYTITLADGTTHPVTVTNGRGIDSLTWQSSGTPRDGAEHVGTFTYNDGTSGTITLYDGAKGDTGATWHVWVKYANAMPTSDNDMLDTPSNYIGVYSGAATTAPTSYAAYTWYLWKGDKGDTGTSIVGVMLYSSSGIVDTYRVYFSDDTYTSFSVTNGAQIDRIEKTLTRGLTDTYTVYLTDGTSDTTFTVTNGRGISSITEVDVTHVAGHTDVYQMNFNDGDSYTFRIYNGSNGSGSVSTVDSIQATDQNVPLLTLGQGAPTTSTQGQVKSRYFDQVNSVLYICVGIDTSGAETTYTWQGTTVTVDSALSSTSTNPVQNAILTAIIGTATPTTTAQTLTGAVNELNAGLAAKVNQSDFAKSTLQAAVKAVTANGSFSNTLSGLTANHVVGNWGLFSDAACTTPISINQPNCDITISTSANAWTLTIANFSSTFYIRPTFILKQN